METDIFSCLQKTLMEHLETSNETFKIGLQAMKTSQRVSEGDFVVFTNNKDDDKTHQILNDISENLKSPIQRIRIQTNRLLVSLNRKEMFTNCIQLINSMSSNYGCSLQFFEKKIYFICDGRNSLENFTDYRVIYLVETAKKLASAVGFTIQENDQCDTTKLLFTHKSNNSMNTAQYRLVLCGVVQNAKTKAKETNITVTEYKSIKNESLMEEMKYRDKLLQHTTILLTDALLKFNLLRVKINSPVVMNFNPALEDSDSTVIFIMYNYSRLNAIIHEYNDRVKKKYYPPLPPVESVDFSVLHEEKEWIILFSFLLQFPSVVLNTVKNIEEGKFAPNVLYNFLHSMSRTVSSYYRSTKVLLYNQSQLLPIIAARVHLIKAVHQVFTNGFALLSIKPTPAL